jgi:hypothetical protein
MAGLRETFAAIEAAKAGKTATLMQADASSATGEPPEEVAKNTAPDPAIGFVPINPEDHLKIREQYRAAKEARWQAATQGLASQTHEMRKAALATAQQYAQTFVRTAFLLNGGSILALLTFVGSLYAKGDHATTIVAISFSRAIYPAFIAFVFGLIAISLTAAIAYFNWLWVTSSYMHEADTFHLVLGQNKISDPPKVEWKINTSLIASIFFALTSLGCFAFGSFLVADSFRVLGVQ